MRDRSGTIPEYFDDYSTTMIVIASRVVSASNGMSASFLYESAKDVLKWHNLSVKEHINTVMQIGVLLNLDDEAWSKFKYTGTKKMLDGDDIDRMAQVLSKD